MLGDFNVVEDALDRIPPKADPPGASTALHNLRTHLQLKDGWQSENPDTLAYTFAQSAFQGGSQSHLDRIYLNSELIPFSKEWEVSPPSIHTDHQLVSARISSKQMPFVGRGRWSLPLYVLKDEELTNKVLELGKSLHREINETKDGRTADSNPQLAFSHFKTATIKLCRNTAKKLILKKKNKLLSQLKATLADRNLSEEDRQIVSLQIQEELNHLEIIQHECARDHLTTKIRIESESATSKFWAKSGKDQKPRDSIIELRDINSPSDNPVYEHRSDRMAEIVRDYYNELQHDGIATKDEKDAALNAVLNTVTIKLPAADRSELEHKLTKANIEEVLHLLPNGKALGIDGVPYELWKWIHQKSKSISANSKEGDPPFEFAECLIAVYNNIELHGVAPNSCFAEGLLNPLHKKNDRREIANYRPITLLNCDYKAFTKALALKLARTIPSIIHENQAGFVPGRSITDQIRLTQMIMEYAKVKEVNGVIVTLDQEKVYDKIAHNYLWKVLEKFDLPENFINTVKSLYKDAETSVIINGEISSKFKVMRGV